MASTASSNTTSAKRVLTDVNTSISVAKKPKKTKGITKKEINDKMRYASKSELSSLLSTIFQDFPEASMKVLENYIPDNAPIVPLADDPLLKQCFRCHGGENLSDFHGVKICSACNSNTLSRDDVMSTFGFSKAQADKIKRSFSYGSGGYVYSMDTVVRAVKKRDGSLFSYVARSSFTENRSPPTVGESLKLATTKAKKNKVLSDALKQSEESSLKNLVKTKSMA